jgi:hypothetical protein
MRCAWAEQDTLLRFHQGICGPIDFAHILQYLEGRDAEMADPLQGERQPCHAHVPAGHTTVLKSTRFRWIALSAIQARIPFKARPRALLSSLRGLRGVSGRQIYFQTAIGTF